MCVSYWGLNKVMKPFKLHVPRSDDIISIFQVSSYLIWIITANARQGNHQASVRQLDMEQLL